LNGFFDVMIGLQITQLSLIPLPLIITPHYFLPIEDSASS